MAFPPFNMLRGEWFPEENGVTAAGHRHIHPCICIMHYVTYHNSTNFFELAGHLVSTPSNLHGTVG